MKVLTIIGTRPEAIKTAILTKKLNDDEFFDHKLCVTAQHREMMDQVLSYFKIKPDFDLNIMSAGQSLADVTCKVLKGCQSVLKEFLPDLVLVQGDTTTCFAGALSSFYNGIKVGHIEAGLRTGCLSSPYPEEGNRRLVSKLADLHFTPTEHNLENLISEGINPGRIFNTGNTVIDALLRASANITGFSDDTLQQKLGPIFNNGRVILVTGHRRENFGKGFMEICMALKHIAISYPDLGIVYPVHLNPNVLGPVNEILGGIDNIKLTPPMSYQDFVFAMRMSYLILTDSGGIQEEAPSLGKPVLVMRDNSERMEAVEAGVARLVGPRMDQIIDGVKELLESKENYQLMARAVNPFGNGNASDRIIEILKNQFA